MDVTSLVHMPCHGPLFKVVSWLDRTCLLQQTAVHQGATSAQLEQPDAEQPNLAQQASAFRDAKQQNMAESVESPEASGADSHLYNSPPTLIPHTEDTRPSLFISPKKQKTDTGHAVSLHAPSGLLAAVSLCMHRQCTWRHSWHYTSSCSQERIKLPRCTSTCAFHCTGSHDAIIALQHHLDQCCSTNLASWMSYCTPDVVETSQLWCSQLGPLPDAFMF